MENEEKQIVPVDNRMELSVNDVVNQLAKVQDLMGRVMHEGEHFGTIPGTPKPGLYKAGAEKLGFIFRLVPRFDIKRTDLQNGHREFEVVASIYHITGTFVGQGVGSCSTMESKYRYRSGDMNTGKPVPKEYWKLKENSLEEAQEYIGGSEFRTKKIEGKWMIVQRGSGDRMENPDIADTYNTVLKMAKKRAHIDAMLTACAASDIFTQDIEDLPIQNGEEKNVTPSKEKPKESTQTLWDACMVLLDDMLDAKLIDKKYFDNYVTYMHKHSKHITLLKEDKAALLLVKKKEEAKKELEAKKKEQPKEKADLPKDENTSDKELEIF